MLTKSLSICTTQERRNSKAASNQLSAKMKPKPKLWLHESRNFFFFLLRKKLNLEGLRLNWHVAIHIHGTDPNKICQSRFKVGKRKVIGTPSEKVKSATLKAVCNQYNLLGMKTLKVRGGEGGIRFYRSVRPHSFFFYLYI